MGQTSSYHALVALSFQIEIYNLDRTKSSFLAKCLLGNFTKNWVTLFYHPIARNITFATCFLLPLKYSDIVLPFMNRSLWLRSCLFCVGRISVLKRWFKTPIQNAVHGSTVYASLEKKTISWACTVHCSRLLFELKWTGKAFIWHHLNVVICDFAFMLPPESAFCSNHDRKRTFLGCVHAYFAKAESAFWNADSKRRSKTPFTGVLFMLPSRRRQFREHALRIVRGYCSSSSEPERCLYDVI